MELKFKLLFEVMCFAFLADSRPEEVVSPAVSYRCLINRHFVEQGLSVLVDFYPFDINISKCSKSNLLSMVIISSDFTLLLYFFLFTLFRSLLLSNTSWKIHLDTRILLK